MMCSGSGSRGEYLAKLATTREKENNSPNRRLNHQAVRKHPTAKAFKTVPLVPDVLGLYDNGQMDQLQDRLNRSFNDIINAKDNLLRLKSVNLNKISIEENGELPVVIDENGIFKPTATQEKNLNNVPQNSGKKTSIEEDGEILPVVIDENGLFEPTETQEKNLNKVPQNSGKKAHFGDDGELPVVIVETCLSELTGTPEEKLKKVLENSAKYEVLSKKELFNNHDVDFEDAFIYLPEDDQTEKGNSFEVQACKNKSKKLASSRRNFCLFCRTLVTNFRRHQIKNHFFEQEVRNFLAEVDPNLRERKRKRREIFDDLRKRGNFIYNSEKNSSDSQEKVLLPIRRPPNTDKVTSWEKYVNCIHCLGTFSKKTFYRHLPKCRSMRVNDLSEETDDIELFTNKIRKPVLKNNSTLVMPQTDFEVIMNEKILKVLQKDELGLIATNDRLIMAMASQFYCNHREKKDEYSVTKKMRDAARLLKFCRLNEPGIRSFEDLMKPSKFTLVMRGVQSLSGFDEETGKVTVIGMPARMAYVIQESAKLLCDEAILTNTMSDAKKQAIKTECLDFLQLFKNKFKFLVATNAEKTRKKQAASKPIIMPDDDDIVTVVRKVKDLEEKYYEKLSEFVTVDNYENLCRVIICHIILFNRRRPGEVARAELYHYINRPPNEDLTNDVLEALTKDEKDALPHLSVFMVPGKLVRSVPILLTNAMKSCIDLIVTSRSTLNIPVENHLLFARPFTNNSFDGSKVLRDIKSLCVLKKPESLTATGLRHHMATKTQIVGSESYTEKACMHLGHSMAIHKQNYRFPIQAIQRGQVGSRLLQMEGSWSDITNVSNQSVMVNLEMPGPSTAHCEDENQMCDLPRDDDEYFPSSDSEAEIHKTLVKKKWSNEEKLVVLKTFTSFIKEKKVPGKTRCVELINKNPILKPRTWQQVNALIHNVITKKLKKFPPGFAL